MAAHQAPPSLGFSKQEHWSGLPFPSPVHESEKWKWSCSNVSDSLWPHGLQPTGLLHPWDFPGKSTGLNCHCLLHNTSIVILKILQARLQQYVDRELLDVQVEFRKERGTRSKCQHPLEKAREFQKTSISALLTMPKPLTVWTTTNSGKFKRWEYQTIWPASWEICMQVRKQQLELDMEQQTGSKSRKEYIRAVYCHPAYLTYMQSTSSETSGWMKHKLETRLLAEISITSDMQMTLP